MRHPSHVIAFASLTFFAAACAGSDSTSSTGPTPSSAPATQPATQPATRSESETAVDGDGGTITVFAAASLTESFTEIGKSFEAEHPGTHVVFNFGASSELATQINEGAPVDVFASADGAAMTKALDGLTSPSAPEIFAHNTAEIAVEPGNPLKIQGVDDLARPDIVLVVCAPDVPCGRYASEVFQRAHIEVHPASLEANVKSVVSKVALGEADAGLVYHSDVVASDGKIDGVEIPAAANVTADYPIAAMNPSGTNGELATEFIEYVTGASGQQALQSSGFATGGS